MTHDERKKMLDKVLALWDSYPDLRLGQLMENLAGLKEAFYITDKELDDNLTKVLKSNWNELYEK